MRIVSPLTLLALALSTASASAVTTLNSTAGFFNLASGNWSNGAPGVGNLGTIDVDYTIGNNVNMSSAGATSVTQTAGAGTGSNQWNYHSNTNYTFNLDGGSITSTGGDFFVNNNTFNVGGGTLTKTGGEFRVTGSSADFTVSAGTVTAGTFLVQSGGAATVSGGSLSVTQLLARGGTLTMTGGSITNTNTAIFFNRNSGSGAHTIDLSGGSITASGHSLSNNTGITTTIGGSFSATGTSIVNLFNGANHANSSSINFTSDWTGSLTFDSATAWDDIFEAGDVSYDGTELVSDDFETYFQNNSGVITLIPEPSTTLLGVLGFAGLLRRRRRA